MSIDVTVRQEFGSNEPSGEQWLDTHKNEFQKVLEPEEFERFLNLTPSQYNVALSKAYFRRLDTITQYDAVITAAYLECFIGTKSIDEVADEFEVHPLELETFANNMPQYLAEAVPAVLRYDGEIGRRIVAEVVSVENTHGLPTSSVDADTIENISEIDAADHLNDGGGDGESATQVSQLQIPHGDHDKESLIEECAASDQDALLLPKRSHQYLNRMFRNIDEEMLIVQNLPQTVETILETYHSSKTRMVSGQRDKDRIILTAFLEGMSYEEIAEIEGVTISANSIQQFVSTMKRAVINQLYDQPKNTTTNSVTNVSQSSEAAVDSNTGSSTLDEASQYGLSLLPKPEMVRRTSQLLKMVYQGNIDESVAEEIDFDDDLRQQFINVSVLKLYANNAGLPERYQLLRTERLHRYFSTNSFTSEEKSKWFYHNETKLLEDLRHFDTVMKRVHGLSDSLSSDFNQSDMNLPELVRRYLLSQNPELTFSGPVPEIQAPKSITQQQRSQVSVQINDTPRSIESRLSLPDLFPVAMRPPAGWIENDHFHKRYDNDISELLNQAGLMGVLTPSAVLSIKSQLEMPIEALPRMESVFEETDPLAQLRIITAKNKGRLDTLLDDERAAPRVQVMNRIVELFIENRKTCSQIQDLYRGNPEAVLLLKGALGEILRSALLKR